MGGWCGSDAHCCVSRLMLSAVLQHEGGLPNLLSKLSSFRAFQGWQNAYAAQAAAPAQTSAQTSAGPQVTTAACLQVCADVERQACTRQM